MLEINDLLNKLEAGLKRIIVERQLTNPLMIGIRTGGVWIAEQMHQRLNINEPLGLLDISFPDSAARNRFLTSSREASPPSSSSAAANPASPVRIPATNV